MLPLELIRQAQDRLRGRVHRTPLVRSAALTEKLGTPVWLKLELLQKTGSFKPRGAFNKLLTLAPDERARGVVAVSGGNHAQAVAYVARELGIRATICMPANTPRNYLDATRGYGAEVVLGPDIRAAFAEANRLRDEGRVLIHPFDDPLLAAGQGTVGLEVLEDLPGVTHVYVSIGGGGLIAGVASALKAVKPDVTVIGVETEGPTPWRRPWRPVIPWSCRPSRPSPGRSGPRWCRTSPSVWSGSWSRRSSWWTTGPRWPPWRSCWSGRST